MTEIDLARDYIRVILALGVLSTVAVFLRLVARWRSTASFSADDALIVVAWLMMLGSVINTSYMYLVGGMGQDFTVLSSHSREVFFKAFYASQILYYLTMTPTKLSVLFLYRRIFTTRTFHLIALAVIAIVIAWCIGGLLPTIFQCRPLPAAWDSNVQGQCVDVPKLFLAGTVANLLTDVLILCLPLRVIWKLKLSLRDRITVSGIFLVGGIVCVTALVRILVQIGLTVTNPTIDLLICSLWTIIEPELAILSACLPTLRPLFSLPNPLSKYLPYKLPFSSKLSFLSSSNPSSKSQPRSFSRTKNSWYGLPSDSTRRVHGESTTVTTATAEGWEGSGERGGRGDRGEREERMSKGVYNVESIPLRGLKEGEAEDKAVRDWLGQRRRGSEAKVWSDGEEAGMEGIYVRREVTVV
ncbi:hypothetical protein MMC30_004024 [Trapelia coarctata]|nr:hypothetical protein [Trapelia coarctata]